MQFRWPVQSLSAVESFILDLSNADFQHVPSSAASPAARPHSLAPLQNISPFTMTEVNWRPFPLRTSDDWIPWYAAVKVQATTWGIWDYIDPEALATSLKRPPVRPPFPTVGQIKQGALDIRELDEKERATYDTLGCAYDCQLKHFSYYQEAIGKLELGIRQSLTKDYQRLIISRPLRDVIITLQSRFAPTDISRMRQISKKWYNLRIQQPPSKNFDAWILKWQVCHAEALQVGMEEFKDTHRIIFDFIEAIAPISPEFYTYWMNRVHDDKDFGMGLPDFSVILKRYAEHIRVIPPSPRA